MSLKKLVFLTGTRADFGKLKPLIAAVDNDPDFEAHVFVTGMHMLEKYGSTAYEVLKQGYRHVHLYNNSDPSKAMELTLAKTIEGLSAYCLETKPDLLIVHGDRPEALAGAICGAFQNIRVAHIEGGELSGTVDGLVRHAITKLAHVHFVANDEAALRLRQMGEDSQSIVTLGSPELDVMRSEDLPSLEEVREHYQIPFEEFALAIYHPVTTELEPLAQNIQQFVLALVESQRNYVLVYPNNDHGSEQIIDAYQALKGHPRFKVFPSLRFEHYLRLLKEAQFVIGNSSSGVREAPVYGTPTINLGSRQHMRNVNPEIVHVPEQLDAILDAINRVLINQHKSPRLSFGQGQSAQCFLESLKERSLWQLPLQKAFVDMGALV